MASLSILSAPTKYRNPPSISFPKNYQKPSLSVSPTYSPNPHASLSSRKILQFSKKGYPIFLNSPYRPVFSKSPKIVVKNIRLKSAFLKRERRESLAWTKGNLWKKNTFLSISSKLIYEGGMRKGGREGGREGIQKSRRRRKNEDERGKNLVKARLFGPAIFEAHKLRVLFLNVEEDRHPADVRHGPRTYTLTHSDVTSKLTLAVAREFNKAQFAGWYSRLQRDEILAVWRGAAEVSSQMALHVHCHISGGHFLLNTIARLRFWIFRKELPVVLEAFRHGDRALFLKHPDLEESPVWVHFHSNIAEFNKKECWGPLKTAAKWGMGSAQVAIQAVMEEVMDDLEKSWPSDRKISARSLIPRPIFPDDVDVEVDVDETLSETE